MADQHPVDPEGDPPQHSLETRVSVLESVVGRIDANMAELRTETRDLRASMEAGFRELRASIEALRGAMETGFRDLRGAMETGDRTLRGEMEKGFRESRVVHDRDFRLTWAGIIALALGAGAIAAHFVFHLY